MSIKEKNGNNFDGVRIILAFIVVFAHLLDLTNLPQFKIFGTIFDADFAVKGFFTISGFLVMKSYISSSSLTEFAEKRIRRIYPAYLCAILLCLLIGASVTILKPIEFFHSRETIKYIIANITFLNFLQPNLPGVFLKNPLQALDGSLWTIKVELSLYFFIPVIFWLYKKYKPLPTTLFLFFLSSFWVYFFKTHSTEIKWGTEISRQFPGQLSFFVLGSLLAINKKIFFQQKTILFLSTIAFFLLKKTELRIIIEPIFYASLTIFLSTKAFRNLNFGKYGDISYGIYLYHFPIIQLFFYLNIFNKNAYMGLIATFITTIIISLISWHLIEKKCLKRNSYYILASQN